MKDVDIMDDAEFIKSVNEMGLEMSIDKKNLNPDTEKWSGKFNALAEKHDVNVGMVTLMIIDVARDLDQLAKKE